MPTSTFMCWLNRLSITSTLRPDRPFLFSLWGRVATILRLNHDCNNSTWPSYNCRPHLIWICHRLEGRPSLASNLFAFHLLAATCSALSTHSLFHYPTQPFSKASFCIIPMHSRHKHRHNTFCFKTQIMDLKNTKPHFFILESGFKLSAPFTMLPLPPALIMDTLYLPSDLLH